MDNAEKMLRFHVHRRVTNLYVHFLETYETLKVEHKSMLEKLKKQVPANCVKVVQNLDYLDETKQALIRKRILDAGGSCIRDLEATITTFDVDFQYNK